MKQIFKKNQIMISALAVMIAVAGYLNYSGRIFGDDKVSSEKELANQELLDISMEETAEIESLDQQVDEMPGEAVLTSGTVVMAQAKVTREQVRAQNKELLQGIIDNQNLSDDQKSEAVSGLIEMTEMTELEMAVENMLLAKGFSESVVTVTKNGVDVVVNSAQLTDAHRAQIEDIVTRKTGISPENIVITPLKLENE